MFPLIYASWTVCWFLKEENLFSKIFPKHRTTYFPWLLKIIFLLKTSFLGKFKLFFFFSIFNVNSTTETMKTPKHLLNGVEWSGNISCQNAKLPYII